MTLEELQKQAEEDCRRAAEMYKPFFSMLDDIFQPTKKGLEWHEKKVEPKDECYHRCSGNCRRVGCNCECGEWHKQKET